MEKKQNPWLVHVAKFRKDNPSLSYKDVLKQAKTTYTKGSAISGGVVTGGAKQKKPRTKKGESIVGGSVVGGSVSGGTKPEKKTRKPRKDKGMKKGKGGKLLGQDGHGQQKIPVDHVTAEMVKQV